jgi:hypothetical protein
MPYASKSLPKTSQCDCGSLPYRFFLFQEQPIGIDRNNGHQGEVSLMHCRQCEQIWLRYYLEFKHIPKSGRWYMGKVSKDDVFLLLPAQAVSILSALPELMYGGNFYGHPGKIGPVHMEVDA